MPTLNTTGYAILCQLALRSLNTYELARELDRNARYFVARAESRVYTEVKNLERRGLVVAEPRAIGRRKMLVYSLTAAGRETLEGWLGEPARPFTLECESVLRLLVAPLATKESLLQDLEAVVEQCDHLLESVRPQIADEYKAGVAPYQPHVHSRALVFDFITSYHLALRAWARRSRQAILSWESTGGGDASAQLGLTRIAEAAARK